VRQRQLGCQSNIALVDARASVKGSLGAGGLQDDQVGAVPVDFHGRGQVGDNQQVPGGVRNQVHQLARSLDLGGERLFLRQPFLTEAFRVLLKSNVALHDFHARTFIQNTADFHGEGKAVQQLRAQVAFFRVHGAHQNEARRVAEGNAFAFHNVHAHRG